MHAIVMFLKLAWILCILGRRRREEKTEREREE